MFHHLAGVFGLQETTFDEIRTSRDALWQAAAIVALIGVFVGLSSLVLTALLDAGSGILNYALGWIERLTGFDLFRTPNLDTGGAFFKGFLGTLLGWFVWTLVTFILAFLLTKGKARFGELLRVIGYAQAPRLLMVFGLIPIPFSGLVMGSVGWLWAILATAAGLRQAAGLPTGEIILSLILSLLAVFAVNHWLLNPLLASIF